MIVAHILADKGSDVITIEPERTLADAARLLAERRIGAVVVADALARGDRVELRGFGVFTAKRRGARPGRNPRSGGVVAVPERVFPMFKTSREMLRRLNPGEDEG